MREGFKPKRDQVNLMFYSGVVESRMDPLLLGRCKVRVVGVHVNDNVVLPTEDLPWAWPMGPITSASMSGIGDAPVGPVEGTWVIVFFKDGADMQQPVMMGTIGGIPDQTSTGQAFEDPNSKYPRSDMIDEPDTNRLARVQKIEDTIVTEKINRRSMGTPLGNSDGGAWSQPPIPYGAQYPYNHVFESENGNIMEFDDTEGAERINLHHPSGTFTEIDANGSQVNRIMGSGFEIIEKDGFVFIKGQCVVNVAGSASIMVNNDAHLDVKGKINILAANDTITLGAKSHITLQSEADVQISCKKFLIEAEEISANVTNKVNILAGATINLDGTKTNIQSGCAMPTAIDYDTWSKFDANTLIELPVIPSYEESELMLLEGMTIEEIAASPLASSPAVQASLIPTPVDPSGEVATETNNVPASAVSCGFTGPITASTKLSNYWTLGQLSVGATVKDQHGLSKEDIICNLKALAVNCLDPIKAKYPGMKINSGLRNKNSTGSRISQHCKGEAVDIGFLPRPSKAEMYEIAAEIAKMVPFDQIILEYHGDSRWIHISFKRSAIRKQLLTTFTGATPYLPGLRKPA